MKVETQSQYILERREYLTQLNEKHRVENLERLKNQQEKMLLEKIRDRQQIENDKGRYIDIKV